MDAVRKRSSDVTGPIVPRADVVFDVEIDDGEERRHVLVDGGRCERPSCPDVTLAHARPVARCKDDDDIAIVVVVVVVDRVVDDDGDAIVVWEEAGAVMSHDIFGVFFFVLS